MADNKRGGLSNKDALRVFIKKFDEFVEKIDSFILPSRKKKIACLQILDYLFLSYLLIIGISTIIKIKLYPEKNDKITNNRDLVIVILTFIIVLIYLILLITQKVIKKRKITKNLLNLRQEIISSINTCTNINSKYYTDLEEYSGNFYYGYDNCFVQTLRNQDWVLIPKNVIVEGDYIKINVGEKSPADVKCVDYRYMPIDKKWDFCLKKDEIFKGFDDSFIDSHLEIVIQNKYDKIFRTKDEWVFEVINEPYVETLEIYVKNYQLKSNKKRKSIKRLSDESRYLKIVLVILNCLVIILIVFFILYNMKENISFQDDSLRSFFYIMSNPFTFYVCFIFIYFNLICKILLFWANATLSILRGGILTNIELLNKNNKQNDKVGVNMVVTNNNGDNHGNLGGNLSNNQGNYIGNNFVSDQINCNARNITSPIINTYTNTYNGHSVGVNINLDNSPSCPNTNTIGNKLIPNINPTNYSTNPTTFIPINLSSHQTNPIITRQINNFTNSLPASNDILSFLNKSSNNTGNDKDYYESHSFDEYSFSLHLKYYFKFFQEGIDKSYSLFNVSSNLNRLCFLEKEGLIFNKEKEVVEVAFFKSDNNVEILNVQSQSEEGKGINVGSVLKESEYYNIEEYSNHKEEMESSLKPIALCSGVIRIPLEQHKTNDLIFLEANKIKNLKKILPVSKLNKYSRILKEKSGYLYSATHEHLRSQFKDCLCLLTKSIGFSDQILKSYKNVKNLWHTNYIKYENNEFEHQRKMIQENLDETEESIIYESNDGNNHLLNISSETQGDLVISSIIQDEILNGLSYFSRGSPSSVLTLCDDFWNGRNVEPLSREIIQKMSSLMQQWQSSNIHPIAFSYKPTKKAIIEVLDKYNLDLGISDKSILHILKHNSLPQIFLGMVAMKNNLKTSFQDLLETLNEAGIIFVFFSKEDVKNTKKMADIVLCEYDFNQCISLKPPEGNSNHLISTHNHYTQNNGSNNPISAAVQSCGINKLSIIKESNLVVNAGIYSNNSSPKSKNKIGNIQMINNQNNNLQTSNFNFDKVINKFTNKNEKISETNNSDGKYYNVQKQIFNDIEIQEISNRSIKDMKISGLHDFSASFNEHIYTSNQPDRLHNTLPISNNKNNIIYFPHTTNRDNENQNLLNPNDMQINLNAIIPESSIKSINNMMLNQEGNKYLPTGVDELRDFLNKKDEVPLQINLFSDSSISEVVDVLQIYQDYGEVIGCLTCTLNNENIPALAVADINFGVNIKPSYICNSCNGMRCDFLNKNNPTIFEFISMKVNSIFCPFVIDENTNYSSLSKLLSSSRFLYYRVKIIQKFFIYVIYYLIFIMLPSYIVMTQLIIDIYGLIVILFLVLPLELIGMLSIKRSFDHVKKLKASQRVKEKLNEHDSYFLKIFIKLFFDILIIGSSVISMNSIYFTKLYELKSFMSENILLLDKKFSGWNNNNNLTYNISNFNYSLFSNETLGSAIKNFSQFSLLNFTNEPYNIENIINLTSSSYIFIFPKNETFNDSTSISKFLLVNFEYLNYIFFYVVVWFIICLSFLFVDKHHSVFSFFFFSNHRFILVNLGIVVAATAVFLGKFYTITPKELAIELEYEFLIILVIFTFFIFICDHVKKLYLVKRFHNKQKNIKLIIETRLGTYSPK